MKKKIILSAIIILVAFLPFKAFSTPISIVGVKDHSVSGDLMAGMEVTVKFEGSATTETFIYAATGFQSGAAAGNGWSLSGVGSDTYLSTFEWSFDATTEIDWFQINSLPGYTVFDIIWQPDFTPNSFYGYWQENGFNSDGTTTDTDIRNGIEYTWTFDNQIYIEGSTPPGEGDLFSLFKVDFTDPFSGRFSFELDTDITADHPVPEPSTMLLFGLGLLGIGALGRRKI